MLLKSCFYIKVINSKSVIYIAESIFFSVFCFLFLLMVNFLLHEAVQNSPVVKILLLTCSCLCIVISFLLFFKPSLSSGQEESLILSSSCFVVLIFAFNALTHCYIL